MIKRKVLFKFLMVTVLVCAVNFAAFAQSAISGVVKDEEGLPLPGVTVVEMGSSNGTITDIEGKFTISVDEHAVLVFSFIGFKTVEVPVQDENFITLTMEEEVFGLDEVVAIWYGTVKKSDLTGSVASVKAEEISKMPVQSFDIAL